VIDVASLRLRQEFDMLVVKAQYTRFDRPAGTGLPEIEWEHGLHGGAIETAMMLHLRPDLVRGDAIAHFASFGQELDGLLTRVAPEGHAPFAWTAGDLNPAGVVGDATLATSAMGARLVDHYADRLAEVIRDTGAFPLDRLAAHGFVLD
jgi:creatinine amidohydrolase